MQTGSQPEARCDLLKSFRVHDCDCVHLVLAHPRGNREPETGITPMDNFVCWRCEREGRGAFMLMGRPAERWLLERERQVELELTAR